MLCSSMLVSIGSILGSLATYLKSKSCSNGVRHLGIVSFLQCKNDTIPRGLAPLEQLFDFNDVAKEPKMENIETNIEEHNIGSLAEPNMIKLSSTLPAHIKQQYIKLFK